MHKKTPKKLISFDLSARSSYVTADLSGFELKLISFILKRTRLQLVMPKQGIIFRFK